MRILLFKEVELTESNKSILFLQGINSIIKYINNNYKLINN